MHNHSSKTDSGLGPFHSRHSLLMLALLLAVFVTSCFLLVQNHHLKSDSSEEILQNLFRERVTNIDGLFGTIRQQVRNLQISAETDLNGHGLQPKQRAPQAFASLRDKPADDYFHLDHFQPPLTKTMIGNLTGSGSLQRRQPEFYRELYMALRLTPHLRAVAEQFPDLSRSYYLSASDFINIYPWLEASKFRFSPQLKEQAFYRLGLPQQNPDRQPFWTQAHLEKYGKGSVASCAAPVYDGEHFLGTVAIDLPVKFLGSLLQDFQNDSAGLLLVDSEGQVLAQPDRAAAHNQQLRALTEHWPGELQNLAALPVWQLSRSAGWAVMKAPLENAPWQVVFVQRQPSPAQAFVAQLGGGALTALLVLLGLLFTAAYLNHRHLVWPSEQLLQFIDQLDRRKSPLIDARIPAWWRSWFNHIENIFRDNEALAAETRQQIEVLEQRIKERTIELDRLNQALREEIEERSKAEGALRLVNQKIQELSLVDGLTGIANYRKFDEYLEFTWKQMLRDQAPISIIMCDVDHFKQYNDTYGRQAGDCCLQAIGQAIQDSLQRPADLVARYGGEEFAILLPETDSAGARRVAASIQQSIVDLEIPHFGSLAESCVSFSIGMATMVPAHSGSPESLLEAADQSLYRAKQTSRNRIIALPIKR